MLWDRSRQTVRIADSCARMCMALFGIGDIDDARDFLEHTLDARGTLVKQLPPRFVDVESPGGRFAFVDGVFALGLMSDAGRSRHWVATSCVLDPGSRPQPRERGTAVARRVELSGLAIDRFQQNCGGDPDIVVAAGQLRGLLERTARTAATPPWWRPTGPVDLLLAVGRDGEYLVPCRRRRGGGFIAISVVVPEGELFDLDPRRLLGRCRIDDVAMPVGSIEAHLFDRLMRTEVQLMRERPRWAPPASPNTWWIVAVPETRRLAAMVTWQPGHRRPLHVRGIVDARPWLLRFGTALLRSMPWESEWQ